MEENPHKLSGTSFSLRKRLRSFRHAFRGIRFAISSEHNMRIHLAAAVLAVAAGFFFRLNTFEWICICFATGLVLVAELLNSAIEHLADFISPGHHESIGKIKDLAAAAVLLAALVAVIIAALVFWPHLVLLFHAS